MYAIENLEDFELLYGAKRLCSVCEAANIISDPVNSKTEKFLSRSVVEARAQRDCPLCAFLVDLWEKHPGYDDKLDDDSSFEIDEMLGMVTVSLRFRTPFYRTMCLGRFNTRLCRGQNTRKGRVRKPVHATIDIDIVTDWIGQCRNCHDNCRQGLSDTLTQQLLNLINVGNLQLIDAKSLEIHTVVPDKLPPYVALSYVWSSRPLKKATYLQSPEDASHARLQLDTLPRTLKESIVFARDLKFPYIWIDQICIDQDNVDAKRQIIPAMGAIYAGADLVMIAAAGDDIETGLPGLTSNPRVKERPLLHASTGSGHCVELVELKRISERINDTLWATRGWAFQEFIFARRALFVLADEMFMVCNETVQEEMPWVGAISLPISYYEFWKESVSTQVADIRKAVASSGPLSWNIYTNTVIQFTKRDLTYEEDRLEALAGILSQVDAQCDEITLKTGLPMSQFGIALTWQLDPLIPPGTTNILSNSRALVKSIPSWSWASAGRPVFYNILRTLHFDLMKLLFAYKISDVRNNIIGFPLQAPSGKIWREIGRPNWRDDLRMHNWDKGWHWGINPSEICRKVWRNARKRLSRKGWQATDPATIDALVRSISLEPQRIPVIHLVTIVFHAHIVLDGPEADSMNYSHYVFEALPRCPRHFSPMGLTVDRGRYGLLDVVKPWLFALVGVEDMTSSGAYVMMLREAGDGYYERVSLARISVAGELTELLEAEESNAAWDYIKLR